MAGAAPRNGTCAASILLTDLRYSNARCGGVPKPAEPKLSDRVLLNATSSGQVRAGTLALMASMRVNCPTTDTGTRSFCGSKPCEA